MDCGVLGIGVPYLEAFWCCLHPCVPSSLVLCRPKSTVDITYTPFCCQAGASEYKDRHHSCSFSALHQSLVPYIVCIHTHHCTYVCVLLYLVVSQWWAGSLLKVSVVNSWQCSLTISQVCSKCSCVVCVHCTGQMCSLMSLFKFLCAYMNT